MGNARPGGGATAGHAPLQVISANEGVCIDWFRGHPSRGPPPEAAVSEIGN